MTLAVIQPIEMTVERLWVPVVRCDVCKQRMPADHRTHINDEAAPVAPGAAPDPQKEITSK
jgi:hypothetical protein